MKTLLLGGGVAANSRLRELLAARCASEVRPIIPSSCTDNGAMVAALGVCLVAARALGRGLHDGLLSAGDHGLFLGGLPLK